jgi:hypothetical protein
MVPVLLPGSGPAPPSHQAVRSSIPSIARTMPEHVARRGAPTLAHVSPPQPGHGRPPIPSSPPQDNPPTGRTDVTAEAHKHRNLADPVPSRGMFTASELVPLLAERGIGLSASQVHRLVSGIPAGAWPRTGKARSAGPAMTRLPGATDAAPPAVPAGCCRAGAAMARPPAATAPGSPATSAAPAAGWRPCCWPGGSASAAPWSSS